MTPAGARLTEAHRKRQARLNISTTAQLLRVWPLLDVAALDATARTWVTAAAAVVGVNRRRSIDLAMAYLPAHRALELGEGIVPVPAVDVDPDRLAASLLVTGPVRIKKAMTAGRALPQAIEAARVSSARAGARQALNGGRETITATVRSDPRAKGYERVTSGNPCSFCSTLAGRRFDGPEAFQAHDGCSCQAAPLW